MKRCSVLVLVATFTALAAASSNAQTGSDGVGAISLDPQGIPASAYDPIAAAHYDPEKYKTVEGLASMRIWVPARVAWNPATGICREEPR